MNTPDYKDTKLVNRYATIAKVVGDPFHIANAAETKQVLEDGTLDREAVKAAIAQIADKVAKPTIELKNIKVAAFASEETHCYEASLYVDGVLWGTVSNDGHGGCDRFDGKGRNYDDLADLDHIIAVTYPKIDMAYAGAKDPDRFMSESLETICGGLVNDFLMLKEVKKLTKNKVSFTKGPIVKGAGIFNAPLKGHPEEKVVAFFRAKYPEAVFFNEMADDAERLKALRTIEG